MDLKEKIQKDLKLSLLDKDKKRTAALRLLLSDIKNAEIEKGEKLDEGEIFQVINSERKKWTTAIEQFEKAGDMERAEKEKNDIKIISSYLPKQLSREEVEKFVEESIVEAEAESLKDIGKVMKVVMPKLQGKADGKLVNDLVREKLSSEE